MEKEIFDKTNALNNVMGSEEMLSEIMNTFLSHNIDEHSLNLLCDSVRKNDIAAIFRKTHNLKSTCLYVGASRLSDAVIELLEMTRNLISSVIKTAHLKIYEKWDNEISQKEIDNALAIVELKRTTEPICGIIEQNNNDLYDKLVFHIAEELLYLSKNHSFDPIIPMTEKILIEVTSFKGSAFSFISPKG